MDFKKYQEATKQQLPPSLDAGTELNSIERVETYSFDNKGVPTEAMRVYADGQVFRTSSKVLMEIFNKYFAVNKEPLTNVRVVAPRGKRYLTLEGF